MLKKYAEGRSYVRCIRRGITLDWKVGLVASKVDAVKAHSNCNEPTVAVMSAANRLVMRVIMAHAMCHDVFPVIQLS